MALETDASTNDKLVRWNEHSMNCPVTTEIASAFSLASQKQSVVRDEWIDISFKVGSLLPHSLLLVSIQELGELDVLLRCIEEERAPFVERSASLDIEIQLMFHYQVLFSRMWVCDLYEIVRLIKYRSLIANNIELETLHNDLRLLRIPLDKHEIARDNKLSEPIEMFKVSSSNRVTGNYVYSKDDCLRAHIMSQGLSTRGSVVWQGLDAKSLRSDWLERLSLSESAISLFSTYFK